MGSNTDTQVNNTRKGGEKDIPLNVWNTPQFQNWYQSHLKVGNKLVSAEFLWSLPIHDKIFSYVLHVHIWIAAEDRVKSNEFIISRPDISVVVPYWKHPSDISKTEIILIKEFRSPSRTKDGFVHELPGGSSFKPVNDNLKLASDELYEETSLQINTERFRYLDSKQMMATWSTHFANVYAVELTQDEIEHAKQLAASKQIFGIQEDTERNLLINMYSNNNRNRIVYALLILIVTVLGLASRRYPDIWPSFFSTYAGDTLWALMVFLLIGFIFPQLSTLKLAALTLVFSLLIEVSQLYQAPWINELREYTLVALVIGHGFLWSDLVCYSVGVAIGALSEMIFSRASKMTH